MPGAWCSPAFARLVCPALFASPLASQGQTQVALPRSQGALPFDKRAGCPSGLMGCWARGLMGCWATRRAGAASLAHCAARQELQLRPQQRAAPPRRRRASSPRRRGPRLARCSRRPPPPPSLRGILPPLWSPQCPGNGLKLAGCEGAGMAPSEVELALNPPTRDIEVPSIAWQAGSACWCAPAAPACH